MEYSERYSELEELLDKENAEYHRAQTELEEVLDRRRNLLREMKKMRESLAGNPQRGDMVVFISDHGDAKRGDLGIVDHRSVDIDHGGQELVSLTLISGGMITQLENVMKCDVDANYFDIFISARDGLSARVNEATGIYPNL